MMKMATWRQMRPRVKRLKLSQELEEGREGRAW